MPKSVSIDQFQQAMVRVAVVRLKIAVAVLTEKGAPGRAHANDRAIGQINAAIEELESNLPFITKGN